MVCGLLVFSDLCFEEKFGNIEFVFEFELDFELDFVFHIFHSNSHEFCTSLRGPPRPLKWTISSY